MAKIERAEKEFREENMKRKRKERASKKEKVKEVKREKNKKAIKKKEEDTSSDDTTITMHDLDSSLGNFEDLIKCDSSDSESWTNHFPFLQKIKINHM